MTDEKEPMMRMVIAQTVQNFINDPDYLYTKNEAKDEDIKRLQDYLRSKKIRVPKLPDDERRDDVILLMYRVWASIEACDCAVELLGEQSDKQGRSLSRFADMMD